MDSDGSPKLPRSSQKINDPFSNRFAYQMNYSRILGYFVVLLVLHVIGSNMAGQAQERKIKLALLDPGTTETAARVADKLGGLIEGTRVDVLDRDESRMAARGNGYGGSLNLTLEDARNLGSAIDCDFYVLGDAQTLRRSSSTRPVYFESYASIFIVSSRTGRLIVWDRPSFEAASAADAEKQLLADLPSHAARYTAAILAAAESERNEREFAVTHGTPIIEEAPDESSAETKGLRLPAPYKRIRPPYPDTAARAEAEAVVDVLVDLDAEGEVIRVEIARWAGFGLDEATVNTIRQMHFRPAMRDGVAQPMRVLLRYNFLKPKKPSLTEGTAVK
jgi:TonB family protein